MSRVDVGLLSDFAEGVPHACTVDGRRLVLVRIENDVYVLDDRCSHEDFPLSAGDVDTSTGEIECERHGAMFALSTGAPMSLPATRPVATYEVSLVEGRVWVELP